MNIYEQIAKLPAEKRELLEIMLQEQGVDLHQIAILPQPRISNTFPLSFSQQRLWFLDQLEPGGALYNIPSVLRIKGRLDAAALEKSFNEVIKRHEVLRTTFGKQGDEPQQIIHPRLQLSIPFIDLQSLSAKENAAEVERLALEEAQKPFDLATGPLLRVSLLKQSVQDYILLVTMHHIVSDNWSIGIFVHEIMHCYQAFVQNKKITLPELQVQYADFAFWQRKWLKGKTLENQIDYWRKQLKNIPPVLDFPLDFPRPSYQTSSGDYKLFNLPPVTREALNTISRQNNASLFMTMLAAFYILLQRYSGQDDICVGSPVANRNRAETEALIGFFVNTLVLRGDLSGNPSFPEFVERVKEMTLGAQAHQDLPFETLVEALQPQRDMSHSPLFQAMFVMNNAPVEKLQLSGLEISLLEFENKTTKFDLILNVTETEHGLQCKLEYNTDLFKSDTMDRLITHYKTLIDQILENPSASLSTFSLINPQEKDRLLYNWSRSAESYNEQQSIIQLFEAQAKQTPQAAALRVKEQTLSYSMLNSQANQLARYLLDQGLHRGQIVGISAGRSAEMIIGLLATLKAGGVYLPLDPGYPAERLQYMLNDAQAAFLITQHALKSAFKNHSARVILFENLHELLQKKAADNLNLVLNAQQSAYIIYTSGSTGRPKGVEVSHSALANHCCDMRDFYQLTPDDNVLQFAALNFDASIEQILPPLISGATVIMRDDDIWDSFQFSEKIKQYDLTVINPPTAYWAQLAADWAARPELIPENRIRLVIIGGDVLKPEALQNWYKTSLKNVRLLNAYGPTETVITATTYQVPVGFSSTRVPIGRPRANRTLYVLDPYGQPVPAGIPGELYIGGRALAKGYLKRPDLTEQRFIVNPFSKDQNDRLYKTGDRVRFLPEGNLEFMGRMDFQVKIRGFRIELGEIESLLSRMPEIKEAVVSAMDDKQGNKRLVAYFVTKGQKGVDIEQIRKFLKGLMPDYMIPSVFIEMETMPIDPSGKINRRALPKADLEHVELKNEYVAPRTPTEEKLCSMIQEVLQIERVGVLDNFFDLGGHSMMATQVVSRIRETFDVELSLRSLFENPTAEGIARAIAEAQALGMDEGELNELLDELEGLSEEDIQNLLKDEEE